MSNQGTSFDRVKSILGKLESRISDARSERLSPGLRPGTAGTPVSNGSADGAGRAAINLGQNPAAETAARSEDVWIGGPPAAGPRDGGQADPSGRAQQAPIGAGRADAIGGQPGAAGSRWPAQAQPVTPTGAVPPGPHSGGWPARARSQYGRAKPLRRDSGE